MSGGRRSHGKEGTCLPAGWQAMAGQAFAGPVDGFGGDAAGNRRLYKALAAMLWAQTRFGTFDVDPEPELELWADRERALGWFAPAAASVCGKSGRASRGTPLRRWRGPGPRVPGLLLALSRRVESSAVTARGMHEGEDRRVRAGGRVGSRQVRPGVSRNTTAALTKLGAASTRPTFGGCAQLATSTASPMWACPRLASRRRMAQRALSLAGSTMTQAKPSAS